MFSSIENRLRAIIGLTLLLTVMSIGAMLSLSKAGRYLDTLARHELLLNSMTQLISVDANRVVNLGVIRSTLVKIRNQPQSCLAMINPVDRIVMQLMQTDKAIAICELNQDISYRLGHLLSGLIDNNSQTDDIDARVKKMLRPGIQQMQANSERLHHYFNRTLEITVDLILWLFVPLVLIIPAICYLLSRSVEKHLLEYRETAEALAESEIRARDLAHHDNLTNLPNRLLFSDRMQMAMQQAERQTSQFAIMFLDLDKFKQVNDTLGHNTGDELLIQISKRIQTCLRRTDTLARFGGDEFVILLTDIDKNISVSCICRRIIEEISKPMFLNHHELHVTASIGIANYPDNGKDVEELLKKADAAMYQAKQSGKNQFCFYNTELNRIAGEKMELERDLRKAINNNEFTLYYQPVINLQSGNFFDVEALIRWDHPQRGMIPPDKFIPIAEETAMIVEIGYQVIELACRQCHIWRDMYGTDISIAVNISARQLRDNGLPDFIAKCLQDHKLTTDAIKIEITEGAFYTNPEHCKSTFLRLRDMGLKLLLDDFGTGYSSLATLSTMPFHVIKIDRSFIQSSYKRDKKITDAILDMARDFDMDVIAEGVETVSVAEDLVGRGCDFAQGYLFQRPAPADEIDFSQNYGNVVAGKPKLGLVNSALNK